MQHTAERVPLKADASDDGENAGGRYVCNTVHMSLCFFLVFTAFSATQNLEASIVSAHCQDCNVYCSADSTECHNARFASSKVTDKTVTCSWTGADGRKYSKESEGIISVWARIGPARFYSNSKPTFQARALPQPSKNNDSHVLFGPADPDLTQPILL